MSKIVTHLVIGLTLLLIGSAQAQIQTPRAASPQATLSQTIGLTEIHVDYSRPSVRGREIYGTPIAHYGFQNLGFGTSKAAPWRAGANENTKISFTHDDHWRGSSAGWDLWLLHCFRREQTCNDHSLEQFKCLGKFLLRSK